MKLKTLFFFIISILSQSPVTLAQGITAYLDSASLYRLTGDTMEVYYLTKAIALQPTNPTLYELRAYAKSYIPDSINAKYGPRGAIKDFDIAIKISPKKAIYYEQRGYQRYLIKNYNLALKDFNKAIKLDKKNASAYRKRGDLFWDVQNFPRAGNDFYTVTTLDTANLYSYRKVGDCFYELGNLGEAIQYYNRVIKKAESRASFNDRYNEEYLLSMLYKSNAQGHIGNLEKAIDNYTKVINYNEKFSGIIDYTFEAFRFRGMAYLNTDKKKEGCNDLKMAESLGDPDAKEYLELYCK